VRVAVEVLGRGGSPVLLVHGLGVAGEILVETAELVAEQHHVVLPDLRGHGATPGAPPQALEDYARDLLPLLDDHAPATIVGISFGAVVALDLWRLAPAAVADVVVFDPLLDPSPLVGWAAAESERRGIAFGEAVFEPYLAREEGQLLEALARYPLSAELDERGRRLTARLVLATDEATIRATLPLLPEAVFSARPAGHGGRFTLLRARDGLVCPEPAAAAFAAERGGAVVEVPSGHQAPVTAPRELASAILHALR
jgi:pimeloyl-ACP methyl ester carboxylesterase